MGIVRKKLLGLILILALIFLLYACFEFMGVDLYIMGLELYKNEKIEQIYLFNNKVYIITQDGNGYVAGDNFNADSAKYTSAGYHYHDGLKMVAPIKFFKGEIKTMFSHCGDEAIFIDAENTLYSIYEFDVKKIADSVLYATSSDKSTFYVVDIENNLWLIKDGKKKFLHEKINTVKVYRERIFVVDVNYNLCELVLSNENTYELSPPIFQNVNSFNVIDTSLRYENGQFIFEDEEGIKNPLFNVITNDGTLYAKGYYNLLACGYHNLNSKPIPYHIDDWKIIGKNVTDFSVSAMGTVMRFENGKSAYYGFDTEVAIESDFKYMELDIDNVETVFCDNLSVYVKTNEGDFYIWGDKHSPILKDIEENTNIFTGIARVLNMKQIE